MRPRLEIDRHKELFPTVTGDRKGAVAYSLSRIGSQEIADEGIGALLLEGLDMEDDASRTAAAGTRGV